MERPRSSWLLPALELALALALALAPSLSPTLTLAVAVAVAVALSWPRTGKPHLGSFALQCAVAALDRYDDTFQIHYPLPKSDMVAIPEFAAGAMENWGLVTYREVKRAPP